MDLFFFFSAFNKDSKQYLKWNIGWSYSTYISTYAL